MSGTPPAATAVAVNAQSRSTGRVSRSNVRARPTDPTPVAVRGQGRQLAGPTASEWGPTKVTKYNVNVRAVLAAGGSQRSTSMTETYQEPGVVVTTILEDLGPTVGAATLPTAIIGPCYHVESETDAGAYSGEASNYSYPNRPVGSVIDTVTYPPAVAIELNGTSYDVTGLNNVEADGMDVDLPADLEYVVQTAKGDGVTDGSKVLSSNTSTFVASGVSAGDFVKINNTNHRVVAVLSDNRVELATIQATAAAVNFTVVRRLAGGQTQITYRAARTDPAVKGRFLQASSGTDLVSLFGDKSVNTHWNPLGLAMSLALSAGGSTVSGVAIDTTAVEATEYDLAIEELNKQIVYNIVPLTMNTSLQDRVISHVKAATADNRERRCYIARRILDEEVLRSYAAAGLNGDRDSFTVTDAGFDAFVEPGDIIEAGDAERVVSEVSRSAVTVATAFPAALTASSNHPMRVLRRYGKDEQSVNAAAVASGLRSARITLIGPDRVFMTIGGVSVELDAFYLAAIKAGQRTGAALGQPLIRQAVPFVTNVGKGVDYFNKKQLNRMAGAGWQLFLREAPGAPVVCRDEQTTDQTSGPKLGKESSVVARDYASYVLRAALETQIGLYNITSRTIDILRVAIDSVIANLLREVYQPFAAIDVLSLEESTVNDGHVEVRLRFTQTDPLTHIDVTLVV